MAEAQNLGINLDSKSVDILKAVDSIHRDSLINVGLSLVSKTGYYKTLTGKTPEDLEDVASLDVEEDEDEVSASPKSSKKAGKKSAPAAASKPSTSWDSF